ncbi:SDR family oxidoreductase [Rhizobium sp. DKSPLA3]|uniref:Serine 3-dehydrogenase n=1 Tax=Rhizobium quercicola TaxID=2901226 RepID=A0A9X1NUJ8_9HYPH|nr:SDR family oxidoreductase [Rhizobium quercicola]MCD7111337.1 SDR family oxidoreductase [Rhizobium quercicola]
MRIENKVVIVTGASSGIGRATATLLAERGAFVVLGARRPEPLRIVAEEISASGGRVVFKATDVRNRADLEALVSLAIEKGGRLDVIINNAGVGPISRFDKLKVEDWDLIDVNLRGTLYGIAAALPVFARQGSGHMINVISTAGLKIVPTMGVYAATKNAVRTVTEALRQEAGPTLRVTEISPGMTATNFSDSITDAGMKKKIEDDLGAMAMPADAIARGILFAIDQPPDVDVGSIVIRPTAQG